MIGGMPLTYTEYIVTGTATGIPALKEEPYVWNYKEYVSKLSLELDEYRFPGAMVEKVSSDWESVSTLLKNSQFGTNMRMGNPLKKEMETLWTADASDEEKIRKILALLKSRIIYTSNEYPDISTFFAKIIELTKQQIVLKKQPRQ